MDISLYFWHLGALQVALWLENLLVVMITGAIGPQNTQLKTTSDRLQIVHRAINLAESASLDYSVFKYFKIFVFLGSQLTF